VEDETPRCARCQEEFPVGDADRWEMGKLRKVTRTMKRFWDQFGRFRDPEMGEPYLCGNCYFDLTD
jgi:hypothetical protein